MNRDNVLWCLAVLIGGLVPIPLSVNLPENAFVAMFICLSGWALAAEVLSKFFIARRGTATMARKARPANYFDSFYRGDTADR